MMTTSSPRPTAKIYEFPTRIRLSAGSRRDDAKAADLRSLAICDDVVGGSWYHEAAIRDADRASKP